jgi:hypothetical protein
VKLYDALWIDDIRPAPSGWLWAKSSDEAIAILSSSEHNIKTISFDHDLGGDDTAIAVATFLEERAYDGRGSRIAWRIHSANPVGRANLERALNSCERFWNEHNK